MKTFWKVMGCILQWVIMVIAVFVIVAMTPLSNVIPIGLQMLMTLIIPIAVVLIFAKKKKTDTEATENKSLAMPIEQRTLNNNLSSENEKVVKLPSKKKCREKADGLVAEAKECISRFYEGRSLVLADIWTKKIRNLLNEAIIYEDKAGYTTPLEKPSFVLDCFENDYQWKLRDIIERAESDFISEIRGPQHNNKRACCEHFINQIELYKKDYSEETLDFAMDAYYRVCEVAGLIPKSRGEYEEGKYAIADVDGMDGHDFEEYCGDLLRKNGFEKVEITRGSGDQGVDVLAEKDGIKYAIQCKCYSSDLGNKPIQEVYAGKSIYHCQVAAVMTNRFFTTGGLNAAKATGVLLWDRRKLQEFIEQANRNTERVE